jgi:hypothetical protein
MDINTNGQSRSLRSSSVSARRWRGGRFLAVLVLAIAVGAGFAVMGSLRPQTAPLAVAQSGDLADNPVIGVWRLVDDVGDPLGDNYALFHADGTYVDVGVRTTLLGIWRPTGENTLEVLEVTGSLGLPNEAFIPGTQLVRTTYTYDPSTDTLTGIYSPTLSDANGEVAISGARYSIQGYRVNFETMFPATPTP